MRVLVTGATGFFGPEIVARLRAAGHDVIGTSRGRGRGDRIEPLEVTSPESCSRVFEVAGPLDAVVHAAALAHVRPGKISEDLCHAVNVIGTQNVIRAAVHAGVRRVVFISSVMVYGDFDLPRVVTETDPCKAEGIYGKAKVDAEAACRKQGDLVSLHILRMATMYSADWFANIRKRVRPFLRGRPLYFTLDPLGRRYSLCSMVNGAEAVRWCIEQRLPPDVYNVADQYEYSQQDILRAVEQADGPGWHVPVPITLPRAMWQLVRLTVPSARWRANAHSRYWKFCEHNLYSSERLRCRGFEAPPDLLALGQAGEPRRL